MKKIILVLMFSLGLVSAGNIDAVCGNDGNQWRFEKRVKKLADSIVSFTEGSGDFDFNKRTEAVKLYNQLNSIMYSYHSKEFKIDNKESICAYMNVYDLSFLNTQLTQDDIEQFERYVAENNDYEQYEKYKEPYLQMLQFFKYYHKYIPSSYKTMKGYYIGSVVAVILDLKQNNSEIRSARYVYGKNQNTYMYGLSFDDFKKEVVKKTTCSEVTANSKEELVECAKNKKILPPIVKWAESNMKQKGGQK